MIDYIKTKAFSKVLGLAILVVVMVVFWAATSHYYIDNTIHVGDPFPDFQVSSEDQHLQFSEIDGSYKFVALDASWCQDCDSIYSEQFQTIGNQYDVVAVWIPMDSMGIAHSMWEYRGNYLESSVQSLINQLSISFLPSSFLVDPEGKVVSATNPS